LQSLRAGPNGGAAGASGIDHALTGQAIVGRPVAVVVDSVTRFGRGTDGAGTGVPNAVDAGASAEATRTHVGPAGADASVNTLQTFVHIPVAVVVEAVEDLLRRADRPNAGAPGCTALVGGASLETRHTLAHVGTARLGVSDRAGAEQTIVRRAVAVVVQAVARLVGGAGVAFAGTPYSTNTGHRTGNTLPLGKPAGESLPFNARRHADAVPVRARLVRRTLNTATTAVLRVYEEWHAGATAVEHSCVGKTTAVAFHAQ